MLFLYLDITIYSVECIKHECLYHRFLKNNRSITSSISISLIAYREYVCITWQSLDVLVALNEYEINDI